MALNGGRDQIAVRAATDGWAAFERPLPAHLLRALGSSRPGLFVDVGANTGFFSLLAASASPRTTVLAVEPVAAIRALLAANLAANGLDRDRRVTVLPAALSDRNGTAPLFIPDGAHGLVETSASLEAAFKPTHAAVETVPIRTLDAVLHRPFRPRPRVAVIKIDVEGHDGRVLAGADRTIRRCRPIVFVEVLPASDFATLRRLLERHRYRDLLLYPERVVDAGLEVGFEWEAWNHAFVPCERVGQFVA